MAIRQYRNGPATNLTSPVGPSDTSMTVDDAAGFPALFPYTLIVDMDEATEEVVDVTAAAGNLLTITRAVDGTTAFPHSAGAVVAHGISARDPREANAHVNATSAVHGVVGALVGTTDTQTLTGKTLTAPTINGGTVANATVSNPTISTPTITTPTITGGSVSGTALSATDLTSGTVAFARLLTGTSGGTIAIGNHTHTIPGPDVQNFIASGTWTKPAGAKSVWVQVQGGGGGGEAGDDPLGINGAGGGAGAYVSSMLDAADCNSTEAVTIGTGGAGGTGSAGANGTSGGSSIFDTIPGSVTAGGGGGATFSGGTGGNTGVGDLFVTGGDGAGGSTGSNECGGIGGSSFFGGGGRGGTGSTVGLAGSAYGSGGGGGGESGNRAGGAGCPGVVIVTTYF